MAVNWDALRAMTDAGMTPAQIQAIDPNRGDVLRRAYGWASAFADIPELSSILDRAVAEQWTDDLLVAAIQNSEWAVSRRQAQVDYEVNRRINPADVAAEREALETAMADRATAIGFTLSPERLDTLSGWILKNGLTPEEADDLLLAEFHFDPTAQGQLPQGQAAATLEGLRSAARDYMVPVSDQALGMWVEALIKGQQAPESFQAWLANQAAGMFPALRAEIEAGMNPRTLLDPYKSVAEQELGQFDIDLADPQWMGALMRIDPKTSQRTMPNLDEWRSYIRRDPRLGWGKTMNAKNGAAELGDRLLVEMGKVAH